jgi:hypothetical protein
MLFDEGDCGGEEDEGEEEGEIEAEVEAELRVAGA